MSTLKNKVSLQVENQLPDFVKSENPNFVAFMKAYYEFLESAELKLTTLGSVDSIILESQPIDGSSINYVLLEDTNRYRQDQINTILVEDTTYGAFVNGETIRGQTTQATAVIRVADVNVNSRLFISSQNDFKIGEQVIGATSNASAIISNYTANPVQNIQQLMEYADIDDTVDQFFEGFKEAFLRTIPEELTSASITDLAGVTRTVSLDERNLLKNIKDLYRSKGTRKGHELFFRILLNEDPVLYYPTKDMLRVSDGNWVENEFLRVTLLDDTILMENSSTTAGDIFILLEDGAQLQLEDSTLVSSNLLKLVGQEITQSAVLDLSIQAGGAYYGLGYPTIGVATALIDDVVSYIIQGETVYELTLSTDSAVGTFATGHTISATSNDNPDIALYGKIASVITGYSPTVSTSSQYYDTTDVLTISADNGDGGSVNIQSLTSGQVQSIIVDAAGSGYLAGDIVTVNNANTNGTDLAAIVGVIDGGFAPEAGNIVGVVEVGAETENGPIVYTISASDYTVDDWEGRTYNERIGQEWGTMYDQHDLYSADPIGYPDLAWPMTALGRTSDIILESSLPGSPDYVLGENETGFTTIVDENSTSMDPDVNTSTYVRNPFILEQYDPTMVAEDHFILQPGTVTPAGPIYAGIPGSLIVQEEGGGSGDVTDIRVTTEGWGYTKVPLLTLPSPELIINEEFRIVLETATGVGELITETGYYYIAQEEYNPGTFAADETITGGTSGATATVISNSPSTSLVMTVTSGTFQVNETITGGTTLYTANIGSVAGALRSSGTIYAKGTDVGKIGDINIIDPGVHYTDDVTIGAFTNFLCTDISGTFTLDETVTGGTSGATGIYKDTDADRNIIKLSNVVGTFKAGDNKSGETITGGSSGETAIINSYDAVSMTANQGTLGDTTGKFIGTDGFIDEKTKKIQDSYYYQDYSYVVRTASSINIWRDRLIASVHPAGWEVFGQVDIATTVQTIANITSVTGLGPLYRLIWRSLIGRRLGTTDQGTINPNPDRVIDSQDKANATPCLRVTTISGTFTNGQTITGSSSGATGLVFSDSEDQTGHRFVFYTSLTGIFTTSDVISAGAVSAQVVEVWGLLGQRDLTLRHYMEIMRVPEYMVGAKYGFAPAYRDVDAWKFNPSQVAAAASSRTFNSMNVYPVYLNMLTTITSAINNSETTIPVAATDNLPTAGTIKLETEEITYTGRSTASGAGNLTGATRGANSTSAASHADATNLTLVRNATKTPWEIEDFALFDDGLTPITFARVMLGFDNNITSWVGSPKNNRCIDAEITVGKT